MTIATEANTRLEAALQYAAIGWRVVPVHGVKNGICTCRDGRDCPSPGKWPHIKNWVEEATTDEEVIRHWWKQWPDANVGLAWGERVDIEGDGPEADSILSELFGGDVPVAPTYLSDRGKHRVFQLPDGLPKKPDGSSLAEIALGQLEIRCKGSQSVAPPSNHESGKQYEWLPGLSPEDVDPPEIPPEVVRRVVERYNALHKGGDGKAGSIRHALYEQPEIAKGTLGREPAIYAEACNLWREQHRLHANGCFQSAETHHRILTLLRGLNLLRCRPPLDDKTVADRCENARQFIAKDTAKDKKVVFPRISCAELSQTEYDVEFHIDRTLAKGQPCILAGARKGMKTSLLVDIGITLARGGFFLGKFPARPCRVGLMSGESGMPVLQETAQRICYAADYRLEDIGGLVFSDRVPRFDSPEHIDALKEFIMGDELEVVALDPAYLCMPGADAGNLFIQGEMLRQVTEACQQCGCTPIVCHHTRKRRESYADAFDPPELTEIAWSGFQEWARQWLLVGRREPYEPGTGVHRLWLSIGGSLGHSSLWGVEIEEGTWPDRYWDVRVLTPDLARSEDAAKQGKAEETTKARKRQTQLEHDQKQIVQAMQKWPGGETKRILRDACGLSGERFNLAFAGLIDEGDVAACLVTKANQQTYEGWKLAANGE